MIEDERLLNSVGAEKGSASDPADGRRAESKPGTDEHPVPADGSIVRLAEAKLSHILEAYEETVHN